MTADVRDQAFCRLDLETTVHEDSSRVVAVEMQHAFWTLADAVLEPLIVEGIFGAPNSGAPDEAPPRPDHPYWLLQRAALPPSLDGARVESLGMLGAVRRSTRAIDRPAMAGWVEEALTPSGGAGLELEHLTVLAGLVRIPPVWAGEDAMHIESPAGHLVVPTVRNGDVAWLAPPPGRHVLRQPVEFSIGSQGNECSISLAVYWSPWLEELNCPGRALNRAIEALRAGGWRETTDVA
ncbi:MAG: hypothetical protein IPL61_06755 [Myxococcales bacterium]|nr:hypothetical protein [Myxococcales bacterium]